MTRSTGLRAKIILLRKMGRSYREIKNELGLRSKSTVNYWLRGITFTKAEQKRIAHNQSLAIQRGLKGANDRKRARAVIRKQEAYKKGFLFLGKRPFGHKKLGILGAALYWGEGTKSFGESREPRVVFTNSDPEMIKMFLLFLRTVLKIPEERIRAGIHAYKQPERELRIYWSKICRLPRKRFYLIRAISKASKQKRRKTLPYGTLALRIYMPTAFEFIRGMLGGIIKNNENRS